MRYLDSNDVLSTITGLLPKSTEFDVAVAYSTGRLPRKLIRTLESFLRRGGNFKFLVGISRNTSGDTLQQLYDLPRTGIDLRCTKQSNFHPKMYLFRSRKGKLSGIIGSSNFSAAGFKGNIEANVLIDDPRVLRRIDEEFRQLFGDNRVGPIDQGVIDALIALKPESNEKRRKAIRAIRFSRLGLPRFYFINMRPHEVNSYLKNGKYYSDRRRFVKCRPNLIRKGDVVILRAKRQGGRKNGVVGISTIQSIERVGRRQEKDVRSPRGYMRRGIFVLHYLPIGRPIFQYEGRFKRKGWGAINRLGQWARALRGSVVGADPIIAKRYVRWYRKRARGAIRVPIPTLSRIAF